MDFFSIVALDESPCPRESSRGPIYKSLSLSLDHKVLENCQGLRILQTVGYVGSGEVHKCGYTATVHEDTSTVKNVLLTDVRYYLL